MAPWGSNYCQNFPEHPLRFLPGKQKMHFKGFKLNCNLGMVTDSTNCDRKTLAKFKRRAETKVRFFLTYIQEETKAPSERHRFWRHADLYSGYQINPDIFTWKEHSISPGLLFPSFSVCLLLLLADSICSSFCPSLFNSQTILSPLL